MISALRTACHVLSSASRLLPTVYALLLASYSLSAFAQPKGAPGGAPPAEKDPPAVDQAAVDAAVARGSEWLRARLKEGLPPIKEAAEGNCAGQTYNEIVLYTLVHAGVDRGDPDLIQLVNAIRGAPPVHTYTGAMRAMAFELYDTAKLRADLVQCAEFLVGNQGRNGQWGYSDPIPVTPIPKITLTPSSAPPRYTLSGPGASGTSPAPGAPGGSDDATATPGSPVEAAAKAGGGKASSTGSTIVKSSITQAKKTFPKLVLPRRGWGVPSDNSNTQYAALGLRACMGAGILPPPDCLPATEKWFTEQQNDDGGWGYQEKGKPSYGSMTVGGVSSLAVCVRGARNLDPRKDPRIQRGIQWLGKNLTFDTNPGKGRWQYYWIYGVERAGALAETEWFGDKPWYHDGATWLLAAQNDDGTWGRANHPGERILDTCWAILFLRRATRHIVRQKVYTQ